MREVSPSSGDAVDLPEDGTRLDHRVRSTPLLVLFLDFDGTLAGIADRPEHVRLEPSIAETLARLVRRPGTKVAVISGRSLRDLTALIPVRGLYLAGNHGLEVDGPTIRFVQPEAAGRIAQVETLAAELRAALEDIPGALVENKGLSVACHERSVPIAMVPTFWSEVNRILERRSEPWRVLIGKRVVEALPSREWTKGSCARFLLSHFLSGASEDPDPFAIAIGDDRTDRDLLDEIQGQGLTVAVGESLGSGWDLLLEDVPAVHRFLERIDRLRSEGLRPSG
jgi:trehalose-phosphatase